MAVSTTGKDNLSTFLENFPTPLLYIQPEAIAQAWVFWSQDERSQISSSSADLQPPVPYDNIKSAFSKLKYSYVGKLIVQLWAPVKIGGRNLLSTSGQPFAVNYLDNDLKKYRLSSMNYHYNIDLSKQLDERYPLIRSGGPAAAFLNRMPEHVLLRDHQQRSILARHALDCGLGTSFMLPICYPSDQTSSCIGVVECTFSYTHEHTIIKRMKNIPAVLKEAGLSIFRAQERIPYKTTNGLKHARDEIEEALKMVCGSHNLLLAQVWIPYGDKNHVPFSSFLEDTTTKRMIALKLTGYVNKGSTDFNNDVEIYYDTCDTIYLKAGEELVIKTLTDYKPHFCKSVCNLHHHMLTGYASYMNIRSSGVAICLRSIYTSDLDYAFEFIWHGISNNVILLEALLLTLKSCLPSFKFVSGVELGDQLELLVVNDSPDRDAENSTDIEIESLMIFQEKESTQLPILEAGKRSMVVDFYEAKPNIAPKQLRREVIEKEFGNTMKEAAKNLNISLSTLKGKCKEYHIYEWQGPNVVKKRKVNASSNNQSNIIEKDNRAIQEPSIVNGNEKTLIIKAEYEDDMIKFDLDTSQASLVTIEKEIGKKLKLTLGSYKLKYLYKNEDLILLTSDQDVSDCIKYFINLGQPVVRLRVLPFPHNTSS